jgi:hypothetical protein
MLPRRISLLAPAPRLGGALPGSINASVGMPFRSGHGDAAARAGTRAFSSCDVGGRTLAGATRP